MRSGGGHDPGRAGHRLGFPHADRVEGIVAVVGGSAGAIGAGRPQLLIKDRMPIHIIPARVENPAVPQDDRIPLVGFVEGNRPGQRTVGSGCCQGIGWARTATAPVESAAAGGDEEDIAIGQVARREIVVRSIGQLAQARAVGLYFIESIEAIEVTLAIGGHAIDLTIREQDTPTVEGDLRMLIAAWRQMVGDQGPCLQRSTWRVEHEQTATWARATAVILG